MADDFDQILEQIIERLSADKRVSYRLLKRRYDLDDDALEDVRDELIYARRVAEDEDGRVLVWRATAAVPGGSGDIVTAEAQKEALAERRHLTVVFFDLADSTYLSAGLDPEEFRDIILTYQQVVVSAVLPYDGHVAQYLGDGVLVYFGYPSAHEDDAQRGVEAALDVLDAFQETARTILKPRYGVEPAVRAGIHTGVVVLGEVGAESRVEQIAIGDTPNIAARLQGLARTNQIVVGRDTWELVRYLFDFDSLGKHQLKGIPDPLEVYSCSRRTEDRGKFQVLVHRKLAEIQGREQELARLTAHWRDTAAGGAAVATVSGEGGIGKSRLVLEFSNRVVALGGRRMLMECDPFHEGSSLYPVIRLLEKMMEVRDGDSADLKRQRLRETFAGYACADERWLALIGSLLDLPTTPEASLDITPLRRRQLTIEALVALLREEAAKGAYLCIIEDLQWCDPSTLELLTKLINEPVPGALFVLTFRPNFTHGWTGLAEVRLGHIDPAGAEAIVRSVDQAASLPDEIVREIVSRADGVPLFLEELTEAVLSDWNRVSLGRKEVLERIPSSLHDSLFARLDRLPLGKKTAQMASVIGRDFSEELLSRLWTARKEDLQTGLYELTGSGLVERHDRDGNVFYTFRHALIRDTAYESLLIRHREGYHLAIAEALERDFAATTETRPELLAYHFSSGREYLKAISYWRDAARRAQHRSAHAEASDHLERALEALRKDQGIAQREEWEPQLLIQLGASLLATQGYGSANVGRVFQEALELTDALESQAPRFDVLQGLWAFYLVRGELERATKLADELEADARREEDTDHLMEALLRKGISLSMLGELGEAKRRFEQVLELHDLERHDSHRLQFGQDPMVSCLCHYSLVLWLLGHPEEALANSEQACELADAMAHPFTESWAYLYNALVHYLRREKDRVRVAVRKLDHLCREQAFAYRGAQGAILGGWAEEDPRSGAARIEEALREVEATGALVFGSFYFAILAEVEAGVSAERRRAALERGLELAERTGERIFYAELLRLDAHRLLDEERDVPGAAERLVEARELAGEQGARSLLLRIATSEFRLNPDAGARARLEALLGDFGTERHLADRRAASDALKVG